MPQVTVHVGGRPFDVACQDGEESYLKIAARLLDDEAAQMASQLGRLSESRMLLMAGLMLADRSVATNERLQSAEDEIAQLRRDLSDLQSRPAERIEVPVIPVELTDAMAEIAARAEALADEIDPQT